MPEVADLLAQISGTGLAPVPVENTPTFDLLEQLRTGEAPEQLRTRRIEEARARVGEAFKDGEGPLHYAGMRAIPFVSSLLRTQTEERFREAQKRVTAGTASTDDYTVVAGRERADQIHRERSTGESIAEGLAHIPALLGEAYLAGGALKGVGLVGQGAARTAPAAGTLAGRAVQAAPGVVGRAAVTTPLMPSFYAERAAQEATKSGGETTDFKNLAPALAYGTAQTAVLGSLGRVAQSVPSVGGRLAARTGVGLAEQQAVDVGATAIDRAAQRLTGQSLGLDTGYGTGGSIIRGDDGALKNALVQATTFAAFSAMHLPADVRESRSRGQATQPPPVMRAAAAVLKEQSAKQVPATEAAARLTQIGAPFEALLNAEPAVAKEGVKALLEQDGLTYAESRYRSLLADAVTRAKEAEAKRAETQTSERSNIGNEDPLPEPPGGDADANLADVRSRQISPPGPEVAPERPATAPEAPDAANERISRPDVAPEPAPEAVPEPTLVRSPDPILENESRPPVDAAPGAVTPPEPPVTAPARSPVASVIALRDRLTGKARDALDVPLHNTDAESGGPGADPVYLGRRVAAEYRRLAESGGTEADLAGVGEALQELGFEPVEGEAPYDPARHVYRPEVRKGVVTGEPVAEGAPVAVTRKGWTAPDGTVVERAEVDRPKAQAKPTTAVERMRSRLAAKGRATVATRAEAAPDVGESRLERTGRERVARTGKDIEAEASAYEDFDSMPDALQGEYRKSVFTPENYAEKGLTPEQVRALEGLLGGDQGLRKLAVKENITHEGVRKRAMAALKKLGKEGTVDQLLKAEQYDRQLNAEAQGRTKGHLDYEEAERVTKKHHDFDEDIRRQMDEATKRFERENPAPTAEALDRFAGEIEALHVRLGKGPGSKGQGEAGVPGAGQAAAESPGVRYGPQTDPLGPTGGPTGRVAGPFDINAEILTAFKMPRFVGRSGSTAPAEYRTHARQLATSGKDVGNVALTVHELAHHLQAERGLDLSNVPADVAEGFESFDYQPNRTNKKIAVEEGFAEYLRLRLTGELQALTPEQQSAANHFEAWAKKTGDLPILENVAGMIAKWRAGTPLERAASLVSATGKELPTTQATVVEAARELFDDRAGSITRMMAERKRLGMADLPVGKDPYTVWRHFNPLANHLADQMAGEGVQTWKKDANGSWRQSTTGKPADWITEGHAPADLAPDYRGPGGKIGEVYRRLTGKATAPSRLGTWLLARHVVNEHARGREVATREQVEDFERLLAHEGATDPAFAQRAAESLKRYTETMNQTIETLVDVGDLTRKQADAMRAKYPDYVPLLRAVENLSFKKLGEGRTGSGRQFVDPFLSLRGRYQEVARRATKQIFDDALLRSFEQPEGPAGVGRFAIESDAPVHSIDKSRLDPILDSLGVDPALREQAAKELEEIMAPVPWKTAGGNTYTIKRNGVRRTFEIGDKRLYDLLTRQQADAAWALRFAKAWGSFPGLSLITKGIKTGATTASMVFPVRNMLRDPVHYAWNAEGPGGFMGKLVRFFAGHGKAFATAGWRVAGSGPADPRTRAYYEMGGEQLRELGGFAPRGAGEAALRRTTGAGAGREKVIQSVNKVKDVIELMGAGEHGPRLAEWTAALEEMGYTKEKVEQALASDPHTSPIPLDALIQARVRAANATVDFGRQGSLVHEWNRVAPFLGAHMAGMSQEVRNVSQAARDLAKGKITPKVRATVGVFGAYLGAELLHWLTYKDEEWYKELPAHVRHRWFVLGQKKDGGVWGVPKPHGLLLMLGAQFQELLRKESNSHPIQGEAVGTAYGEAAPRVMPVVAGEAWDVVRNEGWSGRPIVPKQNQPNLMDVDQWTQYRLPYLLEQLTGGLASERATRLPTQALDVSRQPPDQSVTELYQREEYLKRQKAKLPSGARFKDEAELDRVVAATKRIGELNKEVRERNPSPERQRQIRDQRLKLAQRAMGR